MEFIHDKQAFLNYIGHNCHCVNAIQTAEERTAKRRLARALGANPNWADVLRDWRPNNFAKHFGYSSWSSMIDSLEKGIK